MSGDGERRVGMEVDLASKDRIDGIITRLAPSVEQPERALITAVLVNWRNEQIAAATNKLARQLADQIDRHNDLAGKIGDLVDDWLIDSDADNAVNYFTKISGLLDRDEKGLPL